MEFNSAFKGLKHYGVFAYWAVALREGRRLRVFEEKVLRKTLGRRRLQENGENCVVRSFMVCNPHKIVLW